MNTLQIEKASNGSSMQLVKVKNQNGFEFYLDRQGNPYTYQGDRLTHLSGLNELDGLAGIFKKVSDRLFRDLPKAIVNVVSSPFRPEPVFSPEDFRSAKYGAAAGSRKNNAIVGAVGQMASSLILGGDATTFNQGGGFINSLIPTKQNSSLPNSPTLEDSEETTPQPATIQKTLLVGGVLLVLAASIVFLVSSKQQIIK